MDPHSIDPYRSHVDDVIRRGRAVQAALTTRPDDRAAAAEARIWQRDCESTIAALSGGRKTHWLSRAYNEALLVRSEGGGPPERVDLAVIVGRLLAVLDRAVDSLARLRETGDAPEAAPAPAVHRFDFVHNRDLRPVLEHAYADGRRALEEGRFDEALISTCGILETVITDALVHLNPPAKDEIVKRSFAERIAAAEQAGLIRNGCARLPAVARAYRDLTSAVAGYPAIEVREVDARTTRQVLRIVMRDLDPGR